MSLLFKVELCIILDANTVGYAYYSGKHVGWMFYIDSFGDTDREAAKRKMMEITSTLFS